MQSICFLPRGIFKGSLILSLLPRVQGPNPLRQTDASFSLIHPIQNTVVHPLSEIHPPPEYYHQNHNFLNCDYVCIIIHHGIHNQIKPLSLGVFLRLWPRQLPWAISERSLSGQNTDKLYVQ